MAFASRSLVAVPLCWFTFARSLAAQKRTLEEEPGPEDGMTARDGTAGGSR